MLNDRHWLQRELVVGTEEDVEVAVGAADAFGAEDLI